jgi:hypothetical protein
MGNFIFKCGVDGIIFNSLSAALPMIMLYADGRLTSKNFTIFVAYLGYDPAMTNNSIDLIG